MSILKQRGYRFQALRPGSAGDSIVVPPIPFGTAGTLESRVRLGPSGVGRRILNFDATTKTVEIAHNETQLTAILNDGTTNRSLVSSGIDPDDNVERCLALVFDAAGIRLYVDGVQVGVSAGASPWVAWTSLTGAIGNYSPSPSNSNGVTGCIADVRIWGRALVPAEMACYRPTLRGDESGLLAWWPLEGDARDRVARPVISTFSEFRGPVDGPLPTMTEDRLRRPFVSLNAFVPYLRSDGVLGVRSSGSFNGAGSWAYDSGLADGRFTWRLIPAPKSIQNQFGGTFRRSLTNGNDRWSWFFYNTAGLDASVYLWKSTQGAGDFAYSLSGVGGPINPDAGPVVVVVECEGPTIALYVNGVLAGTVFDSTWQSATGVGVLYYAGDLANIGWDSISATPLPAGRAATMHGSIRVGARAAILRPAA